MNRAKIFRQTVTLANSLTSSTRRPLTQVTHFSVLTQSPLVSLTKTPQTYGNMLSNFHKVSFFSTKTEPFIDVILSKNKWSKEMENEIEKVNPKLTHESIVYVLMSLKEYPHKAFDFFKWVCGTKGFEPNSVIYNLMLRTLVGKDTMVQFWDVAREMREKGYIVSSLTYDDVHASLPKNLRHLKKDWSEYNKNMLEEDVKVAVDNKVVEVISGSEWNEDVESKLKEIEFPLSESFLLPVLRKLKKEPLKALRFFRWVGDCRGFEHNAVTYNEMIKVLASSDSMGEFWDMVNSVRGKGYEVAVDTYVESRKRIPVRDAGALFLFMMDGPYQLSAKDCTWTLTVIPLDADPDSDLMFRVANKYKAAGNKLTESMYIAMHKCLCNCGKFDEAEKILEVMVSDTGVVPDYIHYSQVIHGLCKFKRFDEAWNVMGQMEAKGCIPNIKTWTRLVYGYCQGGLMDEALSCLEKMKQKNLNPGDEVLDVLLKGFVSQNKHLEAYTFLLEMVNNSVVIPLPKTYKFMVEKLLEDGKLKEAIDVLNMMRRHNIPIYPDPFIQYISQRGTVEDVKEFLKGYPVNETAYTSCYIRFMKAFLKENRDQEAKDLLNSSPYRVRTNKSATLLFDSHQASATSSWS